MSTRKNDYDNGQTIADMSSIGRPKQNKTPSPLAGLSKEERRWVIGGALKASLLIALAFIVGLGAVILILTSLLK